MHDFKVGKVAYFTDTVKFPYGKILEGICVDVEKDNATFKILSNGEVCNFTINEKEVSSSFLNSSYLFKISQFVKFVINENNIQSRGVLLYSIVNFERQFGKKIYMNDVQGRKIYLNKQDNPSNLIWIISIGHHNGRMTLLDMIINDANGIPIFDRSKKNIVTFQYTGDLS